MALFSFIAFFIDIAVTAERQRKRLRKKAGCDRAWIKMSGRSRRRSKRIPLSSASAETLARKITKKTSEANAGTHRVYKEESREEPQRTDMPTIVL